VSDLETGKKKRGEVRLVGALSKLWNLDLTQIRDNLKVGVTIEGIAPLWGGGKLGRKEESKTVSGKGGLDYLRKKNGVVRNKRKRKIEELLKSEDMTKKENENWHHLRNGRKRTHKGGVLKGKGGKNRHRTAHKKRLTRRRGREKIEVGKNVLEKKEP